MFSCAPHRSYTDYYCYCLQITKTFCFSRDLTIHIDNLSSTFTNDFTSLLDCLFITQYVNFPTHNKGHTLDLICCTGITPCNLSDSELPISDHKVVLFKLHAPLSKANEQWSISFRNIKHVDHTDLTTLINSYLSPPSPSPADMVTHYNACLSSSLDALAHHSTSDQ